MFLGFMSIKISISGVSQKLTCPEITDTVNFKTEMSNTN